MPEQSKKIVKLNILSNSFAQKIMIIQIAANTESETVSTSVLLFRFLKTGGRILSRSWHTLPLDCSSATH